MHREQTKVTGTYFGQTYTGVVIECRPHTIHPTRVEHRIKLDAPIMVFGAQCDAIVVGTFDANEVNTIEAIA